MMINTIDTTLFKDLGEKSSLHTKWGSIMYGVFEMAYTDNYSSDDWTIGEELFGTMSSNAEENQKMKDIFKGLCFDEKSPFWNSFYNRYRNYAIGWYDEEIFWEEFETSIWDNINGFIQIIVALRKIDFDTVVNDAMVQNDSTIVNRTNEGNLQGTSWEPVGNDLYSLNEEREKTITNQGIKLNAIKNIANNIIRTNVRKIWDNFEPLFTFVYEEVC